MKLSELNKEANVYLHWVKAHIGFMGNDIADIATNQAHDNDRTELYPFNKLEYKSILKKKFIHTWNEHWNANVLITNKRKILTAIRENVYDSNEIRYKHKRREQVVIKRLRTGHAGVL